MLCESFATETMAKIAELNTFRTRKTTVSFSLLIRLRFQGYSCESEIEGALEFVYSSFKLFTVPLICLQFLYFVYIPLISIQFLELVYSSLNLYTVPLNTKNSKISVCFPCIRCYASNPSHLYFLEYIYSEIYTS